MSKLNPGDTICCRINGSFIVFAYVEKYDITETFEVISILDTGYLVKVPVRLYLTNAFEIKLSNSKEYCVPKNFMGVNAHFLTDAHIVEIKSRKDGECCDRCKEFFPMATRIADSEFKCFLCRMYKYR